MEIIKFEKDIRTFYVTATSFPAGIKDAHEKLHALLPDTGNRRFFGISYSDNGKIMYHAAAEEIEAGEAEKYNCPVFILRKGAYLSIILKNWKADESQVAQAFQQLLKDSRLDWKSGYCLEIYPNETDMQCMVKLNDNII